MIKSRWLDITSFCEKYNLNIRTVQKYCKDGNIVAKIMGVHNSWHIDMWTFESMIEEYTSVEEDEVDLIESLGGTSSKHLASLGMHKTWKP